MSNAKPSVNPRQRMSVLVIDDQPAILDFFREVLTAENVNCQTAANGREGLAKLSERPFDIVFLDLVMPEIDGQSLMSIIHQKYPGLSVVIISVQDDENVINEMMALGAKAYLVKPLTAGEILDVVRSAQKHRTVFEMDAALLDSGEPT